MEKIYLDFHGKKHSLYNNLINYPPQGYEFVMDSKSLDKVTNYLCRSNKIPYLMMNSINKIIPINVAKPFLEQYSPLDDGVKLIYSSGHIIFKRIPWVVDLEFATHLCGYNSNNLRLYKGLILKYLESDFCRCIMPWTEAGRKTVLNIFNSVIVEKKVKTVNLSVPPKKFKKHYNNERIKILFVGSQNFPYDFDIKGGKEVFEAFKKINSRYDNLELLVRSYVPPYLKSKYKDYPNIRILDEILPWEILENEFKTSDIFLFPAHHTPGLVILDAMSYEIPIITTDLWANSELVRDGKDGILINKSKKPVYYDSNFVPTWGSSEFLRIIKKWTDPEVVSLIEDALATLIEDTSMRRKMGKAARHEIEDGKFSIEKRNYKLKSIFDY